ncbi:MAG: hypothetical protein KDK45_14710 [Leptospiraceae bacterium]|nr:hypothetical protein [Leptospiraceae bacterium]
MILGVYHFMGLGRAPGAVTGPISYIAHRYKRWNEEDKLFFSDSGESARFRINDEILRKLKNENLPKNILVKLETLKNQKALTEKVFLEKLSSLSIKDKSQIESILEKSDMKAGDIQAIILISTKEIFEGKEINNGKEKIINCFDYVLNSPGNYDNFNPPTKTELSVKEELEKLLIAEFASFESGKEEIPIFWVEVDRRNFNQVFERISEIILALANIGGQGMKSILKNVYVIIYIRREKTIFRIGLKYLSSLLH